MIAPSELDDLKFHWDVWKNVTLRGRPRVRVGWRRRQVLCRYSTALHRDGPVPGQEFVESVDGMIVDTGEHVGEPCLRIDFVEPRRRNQRRHECGAIGAAFGAGEQP